MPQLAPSAVPRSRADVVRELAQAAFDQGERLLGQGDAAAARPWLERAHRFAPRDDSIIFALSTALLAQGDDSAAGLFGGLAARHDAEPVWFGLAAAHARAGAWNEAATALAALLARFRLTDQDAIGAVADRIVQASGAAGWCGVGRDGAVVVRLAAGSAGRPSVQADGVMLRGRRVAETVDSLMVRLDGRELLGSPVEVARFRRVEGAVTLRHGGIAGWAWHPADPARDPVLTLLPLRGGTPLHLTAHEAATPPPRPFARPRRFELAPAKLALLGGPLRVFGTDGQELTGSPLDPPIEVRAATAAAEAVAQALPVLARPRRGAPPWQPMPADLAGPPAEAPRRPRRPVAVVVPVYRGLAVTRACLEAVFATAPRGSDVVVVDDASPEPALAAWLDDLAARRRIVLLRHARNLGFPAAANTGLRAAAALPDAPDVVLLNSDTIPAPGWLHRLRAVVQSSPDIGTASPLSNDATILSYPDAHAPNPAPDGTELATLGALAAATHPTTAVEVPTGVGFCLYLRRECLLSTGLLRTDAFAQGYGEENDFCLRARRLGWRHVAVPGAYVAHVGAASFGDARASLLTRNLDVLERLHPGYRALIAAWQRADALAPARRALDAARWAARPRPAQAVLLITHDNGGGVERAVRARIAALATAGRGAVLLRPVPDLSGTATGEHTVPGLCAVSDGAGGRFPNLRFHLPDELPDLATLLRNDGVEAIEVHHVMGHDHCLFELSRRLGVPYEVRLHDYAWFCPRINLVGAERRYCGEPEVAQCEACVADAGDDLAEAIAPAALRARSAAELGGAVRVLAPSLDAATRLARHFPDLRPEVAPHEDDTDLPPLLLPAESARRLVAVLGALGVAKGYDVLLACARDAARRDLALSFIVIGHSEDDERLMATGRVFITGPYREEEAVTLVRAQAADLAWLPSIWPETWCYALGLALRAGLAVAAFDIGAQAERIRRTGRGWLWPLGLPAASINNALLAIRLVAGNECLHPVGPGSVRPRAPAAAAATPFHV